MLAWHHAFVTAGVDYCNMVLSTSPRSVTDRLQWVLNAAARLVSGTRKYDRGLSQIQPADLHWLDVADQVRYKLDVTVHRCFHSKSVAVSCRLLRSSRRHRQSSATTFCTSLPLSVLRHQRSTLGRRSISVAGPTVWNLLSDQLRDSDCTESAFRQLQKTFFFNQY